MDLFQVTSKSLTANEIIEQYFSPEERCGQLALAVGAMPRQGVSMIAMIED